jgi:hypothetical protein
MLEHFSRDDPIVVGSVLTDLVSNGLVYRTGSGESAVFGLTRARDLAQTLREQRRESLAPVVWLLVYRSGGITRRQLREQLQVEDAALGEAISALEAQRQIEASGTGDEAEYRAEIFLVPIGAEHGWEAAVFDHFQTVVRAIASKVRLGTPRSAADQVVGGSTLSFDIHNEHPQRDEVLGLLKRVRDEVNEVWSRVQEYNEQHPVPEDGKTEVSFYFGQCVTLPNGE